MSALPAIADLKDQLRDAGFRRRLVAHNVVRGLPPAAVLHTAAQEAYTLSRGNSGLDPALAGSPRIVAD